jgi:hypothetical protein
MTDVYLTTAELVLLLHVPKGTLWYWASHDRWPRQPGRPTRYLAAAAQASYDARRAP